MATLNEGSHNEDLPYELSLLSQIDSEVSAEKSLNLEKLKQSKVLFYIINTLPDFTVSNLGMILPILNDILVISETLENEEYKNPSSKKAYQRLEQFHQELLKKEEGEMERYMDLISKNADLLKTLELLFEDIVIGAKQTLEKYLKTQEDSSLVELAVTLLQELYNAEKKERPSNFEITYKRALDVQDFTNYKNPKLIPLLRLLWKNLIDKYLEEYSTEDEKIDALIKVLDNEHQKRVGTKEDPLNYSTCSFLFHLTLNMRILTVNEAKSLYETCERNKYFESKIFTGSIQAISQHLDNRYKISNKNSYLTILASDGINQIVLKGNDIRTPENETIIREYELVAKLIRQSYSEEEIINSRKSFEQHLMDVIKKSEELEKLRIESKQKAENAERDANQRAEFAESRAEDAERNKNITAMNLESAEKITANLRAQLAQIAKISQEGNKFGSKGNALAQILEIASQK